MANFDLYFPKLLSYEGGYVNDPADKGGETNKGITMTDFKAYAKKLLGVEPTSANLKALTNEQAKKIYRLKYWSFVCGDDINHQLTAEMLCDFAVNSGIGTAVKKLQTVLANQGFVVSIDGVSGPQTYQALNLGHTSEIYNQFKQSRIDFFNAIVANNPSQKKFLKGWLNRVNSFPWL